MNLSAIVSYDLLPWQWAIWILLGFSIGFTKVGFSGATTAIIPAVALIFGAKETTGLVLPLLLFADVLAVSYYHRHAAWKYLLKLFPWTSAGYAVAFLVEKLVPVQAFKYLMGGCIITGLIVMVWNDRRGKDKPPPLAWWFSAIFGIAGGFATLIGSVAGPIMAVFLLSTRLPKNNFVGTTAWYFFIVNFARLPIYIFVWKNISVRTVLFDLTLIPLIIAGAVVGIFLVKRIPELSYRKVVMVLTLISTALLFI